MEKERIDGASLEMMGYILGAACRHSEARFYRPSGEYLGCCYGWVIHRSEFPASSSLNSSPWFFISRGQVEVRGRICRGR